MAKLQKFDSEIFSKEELTLYKDLKYLRQQYIGTIVIVFILGVLILIFSDSAKQTGGGLFLLMLGGLMVPLMIYDFRRQHRRKNVPYLKINEKGIIWLKKRGSKCFLWNTIEKLSVRAEGDSESAPSFYIYIKTRTEVAEVHINGLSEWPSDIEEYLRRKWKKHSPWYREYKKYEIKK